MNVPTKAPSQRVGLNRLLKLAAFLRALPRRRFDYGHWVGNDWQGAPSLSCGTTACALGWATTMPLFRRLGLHLSKPPGEPMVGDSYHQEEIADRIFGISERAFDNLFIPTFSFFGIDRAHPDESTATPKQIARKIERFVEAAQA